MNLPSSHPDPAAAAPPPRHLILIGPMGAGKSSIARRLAEITGRRAEDTDAMVRREQRGRPIADLFAREGEEFFRERESAALASLRERPAGLVVATGGGIVLREGNRQLLRGLGCVVFLCADEETLFARVSRNDKRPLLRTADPRATLVALLRAREGIYRECAHFTVDTSARSHAQVASEVLQRARDGFPGAGF